MTTKQAAMATIAVRQQVFLERVKSHEATKFDAFLREMDQVIRDALSGDELTDFQRTRLEALLADVDANIAAIQNRYWDRLKTDVIDIAEYQAGFEAATLTKAVETVNTAFESVIPSPAQIKTAVLTNPLSVRGPDGGKLLESFVTDWSAAQRKAFTGTIRRGYFEGQTNAQMVRAIRGTRALKYSDGLLSITKRGADAMVRTAVQHAASQARVETWKSNADLATEYSWVSTLDNRTTAVCRSLDRKVFKIGKGPLPPIHINCRSTTILQLAPEFDWLNKGAQRASMNGPVPQDLTYYAWLKEQTIGFQDEVLGPMRGRLFRDGGLTAERFAALQLDRNFSPMTLAQMKAVEPLAFFKSGL
jgi:SPP1 gp7 family putative phage head morphogenesis protein